MLARCALWRSKPLPVKSWRRIWKRTSWLQRLYGRILKPSMASLGAEKWIASLPDIPASLSALRESSLEIKTPVTSGQMYFDWYEKSCPDFASSKTSQDIYDWASSKSTMTFDQWVIALRLACLRRKKSVQRINVKGCSSWLTPRAQESGEKQETFLKRMGDRTDQCSSSLKAQTILWATPTARDWKDGTLFHSKVATRSNLSRQAPRTSLDGSNSSNTGQTLNPAFTEALMGWPTGWTGFAPVATAWSRWLPLMRGELLKLNLEKVLND